MHTHTYAYTHMHTHTCIHTHMHTHTHTHMHTHTCIHTHAYTHAYTHMHTHTHIHTHNLNNFYVFLSFSNFLSFFLNALLAYHPLLLFFLLSLSLSFPPFPFSPFLPLLSFSLTASAQSCFTFYVCFSFSLSLLISLSFFLSLNHTLSTVNIFICVTLDRSSPRHREILFTKTRHFTAIDSFPAESLHFPDLNKSE
jgi:hypothetical protein